jgi:hypothetical protein
MQKLSIIVVLLLGATFLGCSEGKNIIQEKALSERNDVFTEIQTEDSPAKGFSDLSIRAQIKTHVEGHYLFEAKHSLHGKLKYPFMFNIDGQTVTWEADGKRENTPRSDNNGMSIPDGGEGMRYVLERKIRLHAGPHRVFFALPNDNYYTEFQIVLEEGTRNILDFHPIYWGFRSTRGHFLHDIRHYEVLINEKRLT